MSSHIRSSPEVAIVVKDDVLVDLLGAEVGALSTDANELLVALSWRQVLVPAPVPVR